MNKPTISNPTARIKSIAARVYNVAKVAFIVAVVITSVVGTYVLAHSELRNHTVDFAQGQHEVQAQSPKE